MVSRPYHHIYLSPHYDDASLSCGGAIHQQIQAGQKVLVITICAAVPNPDEPLSAFAKALHKAWRQPKDVVAARRAEDKASMAILGTDYQWLNFTDCIYRGDIQHNLWYYTDDTELFGQIHAADLILAERIAQTIAASIANSAGMIYGPLAVGHHVDHQLAYAAARQLQQHGWPVAFYEDYPYSDPNYPFTRAPLTVEQHHTLATTLAAMQTTTPLQPQLRYLSEENLQAKVESVRAYGSQLATLFGSEAAMAANIRSYALRVGQGQAAERIWMPV